MLHENALLSVSDPTQDDPKSWRVPRAQEMPEDLTWKIGANHKANRQHGAVDSLSNQPFPQ